ncbi:PDZ and LIM domain protein Zasp isoform X6 [Amyelois transitella]|uniref:PDZ and LIM domain protein Zasp isoform X6 n=1 Tax=Amyelois transitella TaxID=680683 RepID=UPI0029907BDA|nr:PDZ and LIM domain protein Zasp isoform X6 [Amyelois transitella]
MAQLITVRLNKSDQQPLGFRLQGGKDFGTPLVVQKVNGGSAAERAGLQAGDALIRVNNTDVYTLRHQDAQDAIRAAGGNLELTVQRGGGTWRPSVTPTGSLPRPGSRPLGASPLPVTSTSLKANPQPTRNFGSGHNNVAKPFGYMNGSDSVKSIVNKQYNTPVNMYSDKTIAETLSAQTEVLAGGVLGVNFKKNEKTYDAEKSAVFKVLQEEQNDPEPEPSHFYSRASVARAGTPCSLHRTHRSRSRTPRVTSTPQPPPAKPPTPCVTAGTQTPAMEQLTPELPHRPSIPVGCHQVLPDGRIALGAPAVPQPHHDSLPVVNDTPYCSDCNRYIVGVFVRIKDKNLHVECFKCSTCGSSLKNQGYYNLNGKLYCDIHAKLVARQNPPAQNLEPITVPPGGRVPTNAYSTPLPPLATNNNYLNGSQSMFSPSSNFSGPKPFGSSIGSAYSPSLSPRSAPMSPARPVAAPVAPAAVPHSVPLSTQSAHAPFAPTQSVKSIVWPPPNPPADEPPKRDPSPKHTNKRVSIEPTPTMVIPCTDKEENIQQVVQNTFSSSQQIAEFTSSVSYASATMSTTNAMSSTSTTESVKQSKQSKELQEISSCVVESFSAQQSSEQQTMTMYQAQTSPPIQKSYENPMDNVKSDQKIYNVKSQVREEIKAEKYTEKQYSEEAIKPSEQNVCKPEIESNYKEDTYQNNTVTALKNIAVDQSSNQQNEIKYKDDNKDANINQTQFKKQQSENYVTEEKSEIKFKETDNEILAKRPLATSMIDALTTAPERPYSPLPTTSVPINAIRQHSQNESEENKSASAIKHEESANAETQNEQCEKQVMPSQPSPMFSMQPKRGISPIAPIKPYNPPDKKETPIPMPEETKPYIPPDFKINIEPKVPRAETSSPMVDALTTAPNRPFTPVQMQQIQRGSLRDALTIAPDRPYSPLPLNMTSQSSCYTSTSSVEVQATTCTSQILRPIATQTSTQITNQTRSEFSNTMQNTCQLQSSTNMSAFRPVAKQVFPPPQPEEFCKLTNFPPITDDLKTSFEQSTRVKQETIISESKSMQQSTMTSNGMSTQGFSSVKNAQSFFEQLEQKESLSSVNLRSKSGLHKADNIPPYQKNFDRLPSQRGITPEICLAPAVLQRPVTPTTDPPTKPRDKSLEPKSNPPMSSHAEIQIQKHTQLRTPIQQTPCQFNRNTPISMTFQPVTDENLLRVSPARSRPSTPSMINKPAPIIPYYQMNLVTVEHSAPDSYLHEPSSREASRSPTPKPRSRSPAQGPPPNPLKAQAPRLKENTPQRQMAHSLLTQATSNLRKEHESVQFQNTADSFNSSSIVKPFSQEQPAIISEERHCNVGFKSENYVKGDMRVKEDSMMNQNYGQKQTQSQNISEYGNKTVQTTRKTFEEFERTQSAKIVEVRKGGSSFTGAYQQTDPNFRPSNTNAKQVFPPPIMSLSSSQQNSSFNVTNEGRLIESCPQMPSNSGANQGPVCDPTPSTGSSVGAAARGKTFGVSSAPKRGRGVLNKAAVPGSRVPLCASCNGNIRGPFITALGRIWCPEHFICVNATCRRPLQDIGFVEENGQLYCEYCFEQYIAPACDKCHAKIKGDCLNAIGKHFHPECFNCVYCGKLFGNNPFFLEDGLPYCEADWNELFTTKCFACGFPVEAGDRWVEALNNNYHSQCFNCTVCKKNLEGQSFFAKGGRPFCKIHAR